MAKKQIDPFMTKKVWWILEKDCRLIDHFGSLNEVLELCRISKGHTKLYDGIYNTQSEVIQEITDLVTKKKQEIANIIIGQPRIIFIETITRNAAGFKVKHLININEISNITESSDSEMAIITYKDGSQYIAYEQYIEIKKRIARSFDY